MLIERLWDSSLRQRLLFDFYEPWDEARFVHLENPLEKIDCRELFVGIQSLTIDSVQEMRRSNLDVILPFGFAALSGELLTAARYGMWSVCEGDPDYYRGGPPYFWETYERNPVSGVALLMQSGEVQSGGPAASRILCRGFYATYRGSLVANRCQPYWASAVLVTQKLRELHDFGWERLERRCLPPAEYAGRRKVYSAPNNREMVAWLFPKFLRKVSPRFRRPKVAHWRIALRVGKPLQLAGGSPLDFTGFRFHESPEGHFYADPFLLEEGGKNWLFFEDYPYQTRRGTIGCAEVLADGSLGDVSPVLERPYHLSYPCLFRDRGELYMIPETGSNGTIELYRSAGFPTRWVLEKELMRCPAHDSTIFEKDGRYWLFTSVPEPHAGARQLCLYSADDLFGEWIPHPANPISSDIRINRSAGAVLQQEGMLLRLSQDCSIRYGYSFTFHEITQLNPYEYAERPVRTVDPSWQKGLIATHTYARFGRVEALDAASYERK